MSPKRPWLPGETPEEELIGGILGIIGAHPEAAEKTLDVLAWKEYIKELGFPSFFAERTSHHLFDVYGYWHQLGIAPPSPGFIRARRWGWTEAATGRFISRAALQELAPGMRYLRPDRAFRIRG